VSCNGAEDGRRPQRARGFRRGLNQCGYVERRNLVIEYRWVGNQPDRPSRWRL